MTGSRLPLSDSTGGRGTHAPNHRDIENHLLTLFAGLSRSAARRTARSACDVRHVRPEIDVLRWAEADIQRRVTLASVPLLLIGFDPTPINAERNIAAGALIA